MHETLIESKNHYHQGVMMELKIPVLKTLKYMVYEGGKPLRAFNTLEEAKKFIWGDDDMYIKKIEPKYTTIKVDEAPY